MIHIAQSGNPLLCPVAALEDFVKVHPSGSGPLFCHFDGTPLTRYQFNAVLRKVLNFAKVPCDHICGHSFRIGSASAAAASGVSIDHIRNMGRWRSNVVTTYIQSIPTCSLAEPTS